MNLGLQLLELLGDEDDGIEISVRRNNETRTLDIRVYGEKSKLHRLVSIKEIRLAEVDLVAVEIKRVIETVRKSEQYFAILAVEQ